MDQRHKDCLVRNSLALIEDLDLDKVITYLRAQKIFDIDHEQDIMSKTTDKNKRRRLIDLIQTRGTRAFNELYNALQYAEQFHLGELLEPELSSAEVKKSASGETERNLSQSSSTVASSSREHEPFPQNMDNNNPFVETRPTIVSSPLSFLTCCLCASSPPDPQRRNEMEDIPLQDIHQSTSTPSSPVNATTIVETSCLHLQLKEELKELFQRPIFSKIRPIPLDQFSLDLDDIWVDLEMMVPDKPQHTLPSLSRQPFPEEGMWIKVTQDEFPRLLSSALAEGPVLMRGEPGVGKSTFWKRTCRQWATEKEFQEYDLILPCQLRHVHDANSVLDLTLEWLRENLGPHSCIQDAENSMDLLQKGRKFLVVLDGWDEFSGDCPELTKLTQRSKALGYDLLITSRPQDQQFGEVQWSLFRIAGLNWNNIRRYVHKFGKITKMDADVVIAALSEKEHLAEMARIPLLLSFMCIAEETLKAESKTELFHLFCSFLQQRCSEKNPSEELGEFSPSDPGLWRLGKLALDGLLAPTEQLLFREQQLREIADSVFKIGFLQDDVPQSFRQVKIASFPHKTVQEFFAAIALFLAIQRLADPEKHTRERLDEASHIIRKSQESNDRLQEVVLFLIGLTKNLTKTEERSIFQEYVKTFKFTLDSDDHFDLRPLLRENQSPDFITALGYNRTKFYLSGSGASMALILRHFPNTNPIQFEWTITSISKDTPYSIGTRKQLLNFEQLSINITSEGAQDQECLRDFFAKNLTNATVSNLKFQGYFNALRGDVLAAALHALGDSVQQLEFSFITISEPLPTGLYFHNLQNLSVYHGISVQELTTVIRFINSCNAVKELELFKFKDSGNELEWKRLGEAFAQNQTLRQLTVKYGNSFRLSCLHGAIHLKKIALFSVLGRSLPASKAKEAKELVLGRNPECKITWKWNGSIVESDEVIFEESFLFLIKKLEISWEDELSHCTINAEE